MPGTDGEFSRRGGTMKNISDCKILLVDDSRENLMILECLLENTAHIHTATSGEEALALAAEIHPDLILLDVVMPGIDGLGTCQALKANPVTACVPVIFLTVLSDADDKVWGFSAGGVDYITKPFDATEIRARVKTHLRLSLYEQEQRFQIDYLSGAVRDTEDSYLFFANHTADILVQCSPDGTIRRINRSWVEFTGVAGCPPVGGTLWDVACPNDREILRTSVLQGIKERKDDLHLTFSIPTVAGDRSVKGVFRICYTYSGIPVSLNGVLTDITDLALEKEGLQNALIIGRSAAAAHLAYLENIAHEIRTPLNALQGGLHQLQELELNPQAREALKFVEQGTIALSLLLPTILAEDQRNTRASCGIFQPSSPHSVALSSVSVLIVDDIKSNRLILANVIKNLGFQDCDIAESGETALEIWSRRHHSLIFLDYQMEGIDGYETCRRIRASSSAKRSTILGVSASALAENMGKALEAGFSAQISKPISKPLIKQTLESLGWEFPS